MSALNPYQHQNYFRSFIFSITAFFFFCFSPSAYAQQQKSTFSARLINIESATKDPFRYSLSLQNRSGRPQIYQLSAKLPEGWLVSFRTEGALVAALRLDTGKKQEITAEVTASYATKPGKYDIQIGAVNNDETLQLDLEAVVKGNYSLELTTPTGRLSDDITEGKSRQIQLIVKNTGTLPIDGLELAAQTPNQWSATFDPAKIEQLGPGQTKEINTTLKVPDKTIAGDYVTTFTVKNNYTNTNASFRMTVKTSPLSGWLGITVILLALGVVYYLIRKYGRR